MFGTQDTDLLVKRTIEELDDSSASPTYDNVMYDFIDYHVKVLQQGSGLFLIDAIDYLKSDEMRGEFEYQVEVYAKMHIKPKYSPDDVVIISREQLDELLRKANR